MPIERRRVALAARRDHTSSNTAPRRRAGLAAVRKAALALERQAYTRSKDLYGRTQPAR